MASSHMWTISVLGCHAFDDDSCYLYAMNRTALAFAIAPLWVPVLLGGGVWLVKDNVQTVPLVTMVSVLFSYGGTYLIGAPTFLFLRSRGYTAHWLAVVIGFAVGALTYFLFLFLFSLALGNSVEFTLSTFQTMFAEWSPNNLITVGVPGLLGALVGITLWVIARPDQT